MKQSRATNGQIHLLKATYGFMEAAVVAGTLRQAELNKRLSQLNLTPQDIDAYQTTTRTQYYLKNKGVIK